MWYNPLIVWLLKSPFHSFISKDFMLITYTGNISQKVYTIPVNYLREDDLFYCISLRERVWWRNLRDGIPVTIRIKGKDLEATAYAIEDRQEVEEILIEFLKLAPKYADYMNVKIDDQGQPDGQDIVKEAETRVMVRTILR